MKLNTFINYGGNCQQAFRFYEQHLGGRVTMMITHGQQPDVNHLPPERGNAVLHARIIIAGTEIMGSDVPPERFQPMRSVYLSLTASSMEEADHFVHSSLKAA